MKIAFVPPAYFPAYGGTELQTKMMAEEFVRRGHKVTVVTSNLLRSEGYYTLDSETVGGEPHNCINGVYLSRLVYYNKNEIDRLTFLSRKLPHVLAAPLRKSAKLFFRRRLGRAIFDELHTAAPDVIITLPHLQPNVKAAIAAANQLKIWCGVYPLVHSHDPDWPFEAIKNAIHKANAVFAVTHSEAMELATAYGLRDEKIHYTSLGVDIVERGENWSDLAPSSSKTVLFLGRKTISKGLPLLAEATSRLAKEGRDFTLALVGSNADDAEDMAAKFREGLSPGMLVDRTNVSAEEKEHWLDSCLMLVLPSAVESFGMVILEAWAAKRAVITLDLPVFRDIVEDGVDGLLVTADDPQALANAIAVLLDDPARATEMGRAGHAKVRATYSWSAVCDRVEAAYAA